MRFTNVPSMVIRGLRRVVCFRNDAHAYRGVATMSAIDLGPQRALVTGASSGIGAAVAKALAAAGARVIVNYAHSRDEADQIVGEIRSAGGEARAIGADISREDDVQALFRAMHEAYGGIDILVSNAGIQKDAPFLEMTLQDWNDVLAVNLTGHFLCAREAARAFVQRGVVPEISCSAGKIIFMSSVHAIVPWAGRVNYTSSKGALAMLMKTAAQELAEHKIRVNAIAPGAIRTPINRDAWDTPEARARLLKLIPYGRIGEPEDIARAVVWLASDAAEYITGATLYIDGGMTLYPGFREGG
jgi:glucose 1-dehydrogenase